MIRTFVNAWTSYTPVEKMNTPIHYFGASQSKGIIKDNWDSYAEMKPIKYFKIKGDHFSIFKKPDVIPFAEIFSHLVSGAE
jgi:surfactin synthase thioesterase subunit